MTRHKETNQAAGRKLLLWLGTVATAVAVVSPQSAYAQCTGNPEVGCINAGAACRPVTSGTGSTGKCTTPGGYPAGERSCVCAGPPVVVSPPMNPNCNNPTFKGTVTCTINEPVVTQPTMGYQVLFAPGDHVVVNAGGCVQTGGKGLTWKSYVNPSGPNSDRLYHGLIQLPGTGMVRIDTLIGQVQTVDTYGALSLGYEDDDYSDNGYYSPDNGTENQCKGVGPARVTVTITR